MAVRYYRTEIYLNINVIMICARPYKLSVFGFKILNARRVNTKQTRVLDCHSRSHVSQIVLSGSVKGLLKTNC